MNLKVFEIELWIFLLLAPFLATLIFFSTVSNSVYFLGIQICLFCFHFPLFLLTCFKNKIFLFTFLESRMSHCNGFWCCVYKKRYHTVKQVVYIATFITNTLQPLTFIVRAVHFINQIMFALFKLMYSTKHYKGCVNWLWLLNR